MGRRSIAALSAGVMGIVGIVSATAVFAERTPSEGTSLVVRASGNTGSIEPVRAQAVFEIASVVDAASIPRARLRAELDRGIGRFLQQVRVKAELSHGRFMGWRLVSLFAGRSDVHVQGLQVGDVLLRINDTSVERPEAFKAVWDSLHKADNVTFDVERNGHPIKLRFKIADN